MPITRFFDRRIEVKRFSTTSETYFSTATIDCHIQQISDLNDAPQAQIYGATHKCWIDISEDVQDGDDVIHDGNRYNVVAIDKKDYDFAINEHKELFLKIYDGGK